MPDVEHSLVTVSCFCGDALSVEFTSKNGIVMKGNRVVCVGEHAGGMFSVSL